VYRLAGGLAELGSCRHAGTDHHRAVDEPTRRPRREGIDDELKGSFVSDMALALAVGEFGQDSQCLGLVEKVHAARSLQATAGDYVAKLSR
jgi:hypothetical protein